MYRWLKYDHSNESEYFELIQINTCNIWA